jgi:hypothetical protein
VKIDQVLNSKSRLSFYWSYTHTDSQYSNIYGQSEGLPDNITATRGTFIHSHVERLNYDNTLSPTLLMHLGVGYQQNNFFDDAPITDFNAASVYGLTGATLNRNVPVFNGFCPAAGPGPVQCPSAGGMYNMGPSAGQTHTYYEKPGANASLTWVRGSHTLKAGAEYFTYAIPTYPFTGTNGAYGFSANETALPYLVGSSGTQALTGGTVGFPYASFLLGAVDNYQIAAPAAYRNSKSQWAIYLQDSWKVTRTLTFDYGLRWDYGTYFSEEHGRAADFSPTIPNPNAGGRPGGFIFENNCNCSFANNYPYAIGPRLGLAWQITPKTVLRAGWGLIYGQTGQTSLGVATVGTLANVQVTSPAPGQPAMFLRNGIPTNTIPTWPRFTAGLLPATPGSVTTSFPGGIGMLDPNAGRPPRQNQWSIGVQREIFNNFVVEASYVGNRGVWWNQSGLLNVNGITPQILASRGLNLSDSAAQQLLLSPLNSPAAIAAGFGAPYSGFPLTQTVAQSLRPFPQFGFIPVIGAPLGDTWYNSLQAKATKRLSRGLFVDAAFTWQKSLQQGVETNPNLTTNGGAVMNAVSLDRRNAKTLSSLDQPFLFSMAVSYQVPAIHTYKPVSWLLRDWRVGTLLQYGSALPIPVPAATTSLANQIFQPTLANRVPGEPLYTVDVNCHCYDPAKTFVLNPKAWTNPPQGQFGTSAPFYSDYRYQRHPQENFNFGRVFQITEKINFDLRAEFTNIFNRTFYSNPSATNPFVPQTVGANGLNSGGFGYIPLTFSSNQFGQPRQGTIVGRFVF